MTLFWRNSGAIMNNLGRILVFPISAHIDRPGLHPVLWQHDVWILGPALAAHWVERVLWLVWFPVFQFVGVDPILARPTTPEYQQRGRYPGFWFSVAWQSVHAAFSRPFGHFRYLGFSNNLKIKNCPVCIITTFCPYSLVNAFVITPSKLTGTGNAIFSNSRNGSPSGCFI